MTLAMQPLGVLLSFHLPELAALANDYRFLMKFLQEQMEKLLLGPSSIVTETLDACSLAGYVKSVRPKLL